MVEHPDLRRAVAVAQHPGDDIVQERDGEAEGVGHERTDDIDISRISLSDSRVSTEIVRIEIRSHERHLADMLPWGAELRRLTLSRQHEQGRDSSLRDLLEYPVGDPRVATAHQAHVQVRARNATQQYRRHAIVDLI